MPGIAAIEGLFVFHLPPVTSAPPPHRASDSGAGGKKARSVFETCLRKQARGLVAAGLSRSAEYQLVVRIPTPSSPCCAARSRFERGMTRSPHLVFTGIFDELEQEAGIRCNGVQRKMASAPFNCAT